MTRPVSGVFTSYVGRMFAGRLIGFLLFFVILLQMLDLLNESSSILAPAGAGSGSIVKYVSLRAPQIASQFTPFAALLAIVFTLSTLNHRSEVTIMRAAGMSAHKVLFPIGFTCAVVTLVHFAFHEIVVVRSTERLAFWAANDYAVDLPADTGARTDIWITEENAYIRAGSAARYDGDVRLTDVRVYEIGEDGVADAVLEADGATFSAGAWTLNGATILDAASLQRKSLAAMPWPTGLDPNAIFAASLSPDRTGILKLAAEVDRLRRDGADARNALTSFLSRFSKPMATLVMPLLGAIAGFGVHRQGTQLIRAVLGAGLGFAYFVAENLMLAIGKLGVVPGVFGAFFPFALFVVVGFSILLSMER